MVFVIGLAGPGHVGKSTTAKALVSTFNKVYPDLKVTNAAFATPLYEVASLLIKIPIDVLKGEIYKETVWTKETSPMNSLVGWTPRKFLQVIGTECFRNNVNSDFWIDATFQEIKSFDVVFMEDSRFENEYKFSDLVIELERDGIIYAKNHPSAMPPDEKYIYKKLKLHSKIDFTDIISEIYEIYKKD